MSSAISSSGTSSSGRGPSSRTRTRGLPVTRRISSPWPGVSSAGTISTRPAMRSRYAALDSGARTIVVSFLPPEALL